MSCFALVHGNLKSPQEVEEKIWGLEERVQGFTHSCVILVSDTGVDSTSQRRCRLWRQTGSM